MPALPKVSILRGDGVALRPLGDHDTEALRQLGESNGDPGVEPLTIERAHARWAEGRAADLAIVEPPDDQVLGVVNFYFHSERRVEVGYVVAPAARGRGVATRALMLVSRWGFESFPAVGRIELWIRSDSNASMAVARRAGYQEEGMARARLEVGDRLEDAIVFSLIRYDLSI